MVFIKNTPPNANHEIFMGVVEWCGHDSRGNPTVRRHPDGAEELLDDVPKVPAEFRKLMGDVWG